MDLHTLIFTDSDCYRAGRKIKPAGIMVHSTGVNNPWLSRYVGPDDGVVGANRYGNHWNRPGVNACVHAFIGKTDSGAVATYQTLPWDHRGWHCGRSGNDTHISFEICEDSLSDTTYFNKVYREAVDLCVHLCTLYKLPASAIIDHSEGHDLGIASNHGDVGHWFPVHGKSMDTLRADVEARLQNDAGTARELHCVQVGAFRKKAYAQHKLDAVKAAGFIDAYITQGADGLYRVQVGAYAKRANAVAMQEKMRQAGFSTWVTIKRPAAIARKIKTGDTVRVRRGATTYTGGGLASYVYDRDHQVMELSGSRAVITYRGTVVAAVNVADLYPV